MTWADAIGLAPDRMHASNQTLAISVVERRLKLMLREFFPRSLGMDDS
jgi:hypothetical protein